MIIYFQAVDKTFNIYTLTDTKVIQIKKLTNIWSIERSKMFEISKNLYKNNFFPDQLKRINVLASFEALN